MKEVLREQERESGAARKSCFEVALEFFQLTEPSKRESKKKMKKLKEYYDYYGYIVSNKEEFIKLIEQILAAMKKVLATIETFKSFEKSRLISQKAKRYHRLKSICEETSHEKCITKSKKYVFQNHIITFLLLTEADCPQSTSTQSTEGSFELTKALRELSLDDDFKFKERTDSKKSLDIYSAGVLHAIYTYVDYRIALKPETKKYTILGNFVVVVIEVNAKEINKIHGVLKLENKNENVSLRIIKPYECFYSVLVQTLLSFGVGYLWTVTSKDFCSVVKSQLSEEWQPELSAPVEFFLNCSKQIASEISSGGKKFFENLRMRMMKTWEKEIVIRSISLKKFKLEP